MVSYVKNSARANAGAPAFADIELAEPDLVRCLQEKMLVDQISYLASHSTFYRERLDRAGIDWTAIRTIDDLAIVPFTMKQDLRDSLAAEPPFGSHLAADMSDVVQMQASSGTTGSPSYVALTESDLERWNESTARSLFACGIRPGDKVLHAFALSKGFVGGLPAFQALQYMGALDVPIGADAGVDRLLVACRDLRPRVILGTPNFILYLAQVAPDVIGMEAKDLGVELLVVGGEPGGGIPAVRQQIEDLWGARVTEMMGGTDLGVMFWAECEHQRGMHLVSPDHVLCELIDPDTGAPIPLEKGRSGELVYTALARHASPVLRFRSGDHVDVVDTQCPCGRTGPMIRCVGRTDDMLIVRGVNLFPSALQDVIGELRPEISGIMRILADFPGHTTQKNLKLYLERGETTPQSDDDRLKREVIRRVQSRLSVKVEVEMVPFGRFERPGAAKVALTLRQPLAD